MTRIIFLTERRELGVGRIYRSDVFLLFLGGGESHAAPD